MWTLGNIKLILGLALAVAIGLAVWHYRSTIAENKLLEGAVKAANGVIKMLDLKADTENNITDNMNTVIVEIRNAPKTEDAPVAPVLDSAIDRIDGLRNTDRR